MTVGDSLIYGCFIPLGNLYQKVFCILGFFFSLKIIIVKPKKKVDHTSLGRILLYISLAIFLFVFLIILFGVVSGFTESYLENSH